MSVPRPVMSLRLAFAGKRNLGNEAAELERTLRTIFTEIEDRMAEIAANARSGKAIAPWFGPGRPKLSLVSGLAAGADQIASRAFLADQSDAALRSIAAILPFERSAYCHASPMGDPAQFRELLGRASYVVELDGDARLDRAADAPEAEPERTAAYRAQAEVMLRHADILVAVDDTNPGGDGGTLDTTRRALGIGMPVIRVVRGSHGPAVLSTLDELDQMVASTNDSPEATVASVVDDLLAIPDGSSRRSGHGPGAADGDISDEFFDGRERRPKFRQRAWRRFERLFKKAPRGSDDPGAPAIEPYRLRADALNAHYASFYRGTFLLGYTLAVGAVCLAVISLIVLLRNASAHSPDYSAWWVLLGLGLAKLAAVIWIKRAAKAANTRRWSEKAVDYRYLAEGLRTMTYLPRAGCFRPPAPLSAPFATRVVSQSVVDRLFHALVRQANPAEVAGSAGGLIRPDAEAAIGSIRSEWIGRQLDYHRNNAAGMSAMSLMLERLANLLSVSVIVVVSIDLLLLVLGGLHALPEAILEPSYKVAPLLLFLAAILPAAVASLNGIRFQSECSRLADRSERMINILEGFDRRAQAVEERARRPGAGRRLAIVPVLRLAEDVARITLDEVAEWSALYAKEMVEP